MRKNFMTGLVILLPLIITLIIVGFLINLLTNPFLDTTQKIFDHYKIFQKPFLFVSPATIEIIASKIFILLFLCAFALIIGILAKYFIIDILFRCGNYFFHRVPVINKIYKACQEVVKTLFSSTSASFSQVVFVPFPTSQQLCLGLVTREPLKIGNSNVDSDWIPIFVPCAPNPSVGTMLMFKKEDIIYVNMKVDEAMKCILSCGVVMPSFTNSKSTFAP